MLNEEVWHVLLTQPLLHRLPEVHEPVPHVFLCPIHGVLLNHPVEGVANVSLTKKWFIFWHVIFCTIIPETIKLFKVTFQHEQRKQVDSNFGVM